MPWWWMVVAWLGVALGMALLVGRTIREAERRERRAGAAPDTGSIALPRLRPALPARRRRIPVPPLVVVLAGTGLSLEAVGLAVRLAGEDRGTLRVLSMDQPLSMPRMFVTALLAVAAVAAVLGATRVPGRRTWWLAVGAIAGVLAWVKGSGTQHVRALAALGVADRPGLALAGSALVATVVLCALWWLSRTERRDRRRVLLAFALYSVAAVGLSTVSGLAGRLSGAVWPALATWVEESGEVLGAVAVLTAVLVGVAPRLVLPPDWALRRSDDALTVDAPGALPTWSAGSATARP